MQELASHLPIIGIALLFWLLIIRPQSKRQKAVLSMQAGLQPGTEVMLTSGIFGTLERVEDDAVWVRVAEGVTLKAAKGAVGSVVSEPAGPTVTHDPDQDPGHDPGDQAPPPRDV